MPNKELFSGTAAIRRTTPKADTLNNEKSIAYALTPEHELAQYCMTGTFNGTFYESAEDALARVAKLAEIVSPIFLAKLAIYGRTEGLMKDTPAFLLAVLARREGQLLPLAFPRVIDNVKMLRNFVQFMRKGGTGRQSLGSRPKRLVQNFLLEKTPEQLFRQSTGNDPSLSDVVKMVHPKPKTPEQAAFFGWLHGKTHDGEKLPSIVKEFEIFKASAGAIEVPDVPWEMLTALTLTPSQWKKIAARATWTQTRMNLNTFARHGVFEDTQLILDIAAKLGNADLVRKAKVFPYQLLSAFLNTTEVPQPIRLALQDALEIATENVPTIGGQVYIFPDVSGSMSNAAVTGTRKGSTTKVMAIDVAALIASAFLRKNPLTRVMPFEFNVVRGIELNPRDSVMTNSGKLRSVGGGGTNCSAPLVQLNAEKAKGDLLIYVSDNESWIDNPGGRTGSSATVTMTEWKIYKARNPKAKLVCIDLTPNGTTQAKEGSSDVINIGGFSDNVFDLISSFASGEVKGESLTRAIEAITF